MADNVEVNRENELLFSVAERYLMHNEQTKSDNPVERNIAEKMCDIEIWEMWVLTQN